MQLSNDNCQHSQVAEAEHELKLELSYLLSPFISKIHFKQISLNSELIQTFNCFIKRE